MASLLPCTAKKQLYTVAQRFKKMIKLFCVHATLIILLIFFFLFFDFCSFVSLIFLLFSFRTLSFFSIYWSNSFLFLFNFFFAVCGSLLLPCECGCGGSSESWSCRGYGESSVSCHAKGVSLYRGSCGSCRGVCVVGFLSMMSTWLGNRNL